MVKVEKRNVLHGLGYAMGRGRVRIQAIFLTTVMCYMLK
jgi:hypothetical protein